MSEYTDTERMISRAAQELEDGDTTLVGVEVPNLACNLAKRTHAPDLEMFLRFGFCSGFSDAMEMQVAHDWDSDLDLLEMAPRLHTYQGICRAEKTYVDINIDKGVLHVRGNWYNSYEGSQHRMYYEESIEPVCWSQIGYAAGYGTAIMDTPVISVEKQCIGAGHEYCTMESRIADQWGEEANVYREAYGDLLDV